MKAKKQVKKVAKAIASPAIGAKISAKAIPNA